MRVEVIHVCIGKLKSLYEEPAKVHSLCQVLYKEATVESEHTCRLSYLSIN